MMGCKVESVSLAEPGPYFTSTVMKSTRETPSTMNISSALAHIFLATKASPTLRLLTG